MSLPSGNVIPLNPGPNNKGLLPDICSQISTLTSEHLSPSLENLKPFLLKKLDEHLEAATSNHDLMRLMEVRTGIQKSAGEIITSLNKELTEFEIPEEPPSETNEVSGLSLLDNDALNHKLVWISAAEKMRTEDNIQCLFRINDRFENAFPDFNNQVPGSPEHICSAFSNAMGELNPDHDIEQQLLLWCAQYIQKQADALWIEIDQLFADAGLQETKPNKGDSAPSWEPTQSVSAIASPGTGTGHSNHSIASASANSQINNRQTELDPELMDSLVEKMVLRVEDMLVQDDIIPEAKMGRVRSIDLASVLNLLQQEISSQHLSILNLNQSVKAALENHNGNNKLSRRHEDLINIVGLLFEYILDDHQLPEAIKKEIGLLQIPVLKQAIFDQAFLTDREHPARVLLNEMTSAGMKYQENHHAYDSTLSLITQTVKDVISESQDAPDAFEQCLVYFTKELKKISFEGPENDLTDTVDNIIISTSEPVEEVISTLR